MRGAKCVAGCTCGKHQGTRFLDPTSLKLCKGCGIEKPLSEFGISRKATAAKNESYRSKCRACQVVAAGDYYGRNKERADEATRRAHVKKWYGLTLAEYDELLARQDGACGICGGRPDEHALGYRLAVDHDHVTGQVRGLLCHRCNLGMGQFRENVDLLRKAAKYLEENG